MGTNTMSMSRESTLRGPLGISLLALVVIGVFLVVMMPPLYRSTSTIFSSGTEGTGSLDNLIVAHAGNMDTDIERFNGRSFFYLPPVKRRPPPPPPPPPVVAEPPPPAPPPPPTFPPNYTGPKLIAILGDEAWFRKTSNLKYGVEDPKTRIRIGELIHGIELLATDPPRGIEVKYNDGGPYEVSLIDMDTSPFSSASPQTTPSGILEDINDTDPDPAAEENADEPMEEILQDPTEDSPADAPPEATSPETPVEVPAEQDPPPPPVPSQSPGGLDELE